MQLQIFIIIILWKLFFFFWIANIRILLIIYFYNISVKFSYLLYFSRLCEINFPKTQKMEKTWELCNQWFHFFFRVVAEKINIYAVDLAVFLIESWISGEIDLLFFIIKNNILFCYWNKMYCWRKGQKV